MKIFPYNLRFKTARVLRETHEGVSVRRPPGTVETGLLSALCLRFTAHTTILWFWLVTGGAWFFTSCATSRPDLVWTEDGRQYGKASWYDDHGERTASGELYNTRAMTAAHPSLALNTIVEVTNLQNGKKVTVRVNDRLPPIHEDRIIDLSPSAFWRLGSLHQGLLDVEIRVVRYGNNKYAEMDRMATSGRMYLPNPKKAAKPPKS